MSSSPLAHAPPRSIERKEVGLAGVIGRLRKTPAVKAASKLAKLGDQEPLYALSALLTGAGVGLGRPELVRAGLRMTAAVGLADALKSLAKTGVARSRPKTVVDEDRYVREASDGGHGKAEQSFPSGHVACSVAAARALSRSAPQIAPYAGLAVAGLGVTRVAEGQHWPSDVAAGLAVGLVAEALTTAAMTAAERRLPRRVRRRLRHG